MVTRSFAADRTQRQSHNRPPAVTGSAQQTHPGVIRLVMLLSLALTMLVLGVMGVARTQAVPQFVELPPAYLPGNPLPEGAIRAWSPNEEYMSMDDEIHFTLYSELHVIATTLVPAQSFTLGQLIVAWGTPSGIRQTSHTTYIYWGTRTAHVYAGSYQPQSQVLFVTYAAEPKSASPWRGFRRRNF
jgi:hypothetical protein